MIVRCLEKDPEARFRSASELAAALAAISGGDVAEPGRTRSARAPLHDHAPPRLARGWRDARVSRDGAALHVRVDALAELEQQQPDRCKNHYRPISHGSAFSPPAARGAIPVASSLPFLFLPEQFQILAVALFFKVFFGNKSQ